MAAKYSTIPDLTAQQVAKFWANVAAMPSGCWEWQGYLTASGYGAVTLSKRSRFRAHRIAYKLYYLEDPEDQFVCHACDNPKCVNPLHLWLGDAAQNAKDRDRKGRQADFSGDSHYSRRDPSRIRRGEAVPGVKLTEAVVLEVRRAFADGESQASIARRLNLSKFNVWYIVHRKTWTHI